MAERGRAGAEKMMEREPQLCHFAQSAGKLPLFGGAAQPLSAPLLEEGMSISKISSAHEWTFLGEGGAHIVFRYGGGSQSLV